MTELASLKAVPAAGSVDRPVRAREAMPDLVKGAAALGVVCIHVSSAIGQAPAIDAIVDWAMLAVPLFVVVWGYNVARSWSVETKWWPWLKRLYARVLPPFLFWSLFYQILSGDLHDPSTKMITRHWIGAGWPGQYYFVLLILVAPFVPLLIKCVARSTAAAVIIVLATAALYLTVSLHAYVPGPIAGQRTLPYYWFGYVAAGMWLGRLERPLSAVIALPALAIPLIRTIDPHYDRLFVPYCTLPIFVASLSIAAATLRRPVNPGPISTAFTAAGSASLAVFVLNPLFATVFELLMRAHGVVVPIDWRAPLLLLVAAAIVAASVGLERAFAAVGLQRLVR